MRSRRSSTSRRTGSPTASAIGYRFSVRNPDGRFLVEQQAYLAARDGRIGWMRVLCSGFRPVDSRSA